MKRKDRRKRKPERMQSAEFQGICATIGIGRLDVPAALGISLRSANGYWSGGLNIPIPVGKLMRTWAALKQGEAPPLPQAQTRESA